MCPHSPSSPHLRAARAIVVLCFALALLHAHASDVVVFTDTQHPVSSSDGARIVLLDAPAKMEAALNAGLPRDPAQAEATARARLTQGGADLREGMASAYQGVVEAWTLKVTKVPAVVVDGRYVIYGESDVAAAMARIATYRSAHP